MPGACTCTSATRCRHVTSQKWHGCKKSFQIQFHEWQIHNWRSRHALSAFQGESVKTKWVIESGNYCHCDVTAAIFGLDCNFVDVCSLKCSEIFWKTCTYIYLIVQTLNKGYFKSNGGHKWTTDKETLFNWLLGFSSTQLTCLLHENTRS